MSLDISRPITRREFAVDYISPLICEEFSGFSGEVEINILPFEELTFPTGLTVIGTSIFTLSWNALRRAVCYNVYRSLGPDGPYQLISTCQQDREYIDNPGPGDWYYRVSALLPEGETPLSPPVAPVAPPPTPEPVPECNITATSIIPITDLSENPLGQLVGAISNIASIHQICGADPLRWGTLGGSTSLVEAVNKDGSSMGQASDTGDTDTRAVLWEIVALGETTLDFIQPVVGGFVTVSVTDDSPDVLQNVFITGGGFYRVVAKVTPGELILENLYSSNTPPISVIPAGSSMAQLQSHDTGQPGSFGIAINDTPRGLYYWFPGGFINTAIFTPGVGSVNLGLPEAMSNVQGIALNNLDEVVGTMFLPSLGQAVPFFWRSGIFSNVLPIGAEGGVGVALSRNASYAIGTYNNPLPDAVTYSFLSVNGAPGAGLGLAAAGEDVSAEAVNDSGVVCGTAGVGGGVFQGFRYSGSIVPLGSLGLGSNDSEANDINNAGYICGSATAFGGPVTQRAVVWKPDNSIVDLNSLLVPGDGNWFLFSAEFINEHNQVAGLGLLDSVLKSYIFQLPESF